MNHQMDHQTCESVFCIKTSHSSKSEMKPGMECYICNCSLRGIEMALLDNCNHITCSSCMLFLRNSRHEFLCPYCRAKIHSVIYSTVFFKEEEKRTLFNEHQNCKFPEIKTVLDKVDNLEWRTFIQFMLDSQHGLETNYKVGPLSAHGAIKSTFIGNKYAILQSLKNSFTRIIVYLRLPELDVQVLLTDQELCYDDPDFDYTDSYVDFLNFLGSMSIENCQYHTDKNHVLMIRRFNNIHCILKMDYNRKKHTIRFGDRMKNTVLTNVSSMSERQYAVFHKNLFLHDEKFKTKTNWWLVKVFKQASRRMTLYIKVSILLQHLLQSKVLFISKGWSNFFVYINFFSVDLTLLYNISKLLCILIKWPDFEKPWFFKYQTLKNSIKTIDLNVVK